jgi:dTDP-4-amino-4,6-dideoxygalactose transaminase
MKTASLALIPFVDLKSQYQAIRNEIDQAVSATIEDTAFIGGKRVKELEETFARFSGTKYAIGCSSGTSALHVALVSAGIGPGHEVITASHTFVATAEAIIHAGAVPVFVDVNPQDYCLDPAQVEAAVTPRTKAVIPVHLYGQLADMNAILAVAKKHGLIVIEDAAQSHGAAIGDQRAGSMGALGCFSFYPGKNLGAYGDAGIVTTNDLAHHDRIQQLVNHGRETKYTHNVIGFNYRLDGIQAAVLNVKLKHIENWNQARHRHAHRYNELLADVPGVVTPAEKRGHVYHLYVIQVDDPEGLGKALAADNIASGVHYPVPLHLQPCFRYLPGSEEGRLPVTERLAKRILSLPMFPELTEEQQDRVVESIRKFVG